MLKLNKYFFQNNRILNDIVILSKGTAAGQIIVVSSSFILTRLYSPEDFGVLSAYASIIAIFGSIAALRYEISIPLPKEDKSAVNLLVVSIIFTLLFCIMITIVVYFISNEIDIDYEFMRKLNPYLWMVPIGVGVISLYQILSHWMVRKKEFRCIANTKIVQSIGATVTQIFIGIINIKPLGLLLGNVVGQSGGLGKLASFSWNADSHLLKFVNFESLKQNAMRYKKIPVFSFFSSLINSIGLNNTPIIIGMLYGSQYTGWFYLSYKIIGLPMLFIGNSVAQVYLSEAPKLAREDPVCLKKMYLNISYKLLMFGGIPLLVGGLLSPVIFPILFGKDWGLSGIYSFMMIPFYISQFVVSPLSQTLVILEKQGILLFWDIFRSSSSIIVILWGYKWGYDLGFTLFLYGIIISFTYLILFALNYYFIVDSRKI